MPRGNKRAVCVYIDKELSDRLDLHLRSTNLSKTMVIVLALEQYLQQAELKDRLLAEIQAKPEKLADFCKAFGIELGNMDTGA